MTLTGDTQASDQGDVILDRARREGFTLVHHEMDTGQRVWEWQHGHDPRPQFVTRRIVLFWMEEFLVRTSRTPFVSGDGTAAFA